jgi:hypothetical protein
MGFVRKLTGADQAKKTADAAKKQADAQVQALKEESQRSAMAAMTAAKATADSQTIAAGRLQAEAAAAEAVSGPLGKADVALDENGGDSSTADVRKRKAKFGRNYSSAGGVGI